MVRPPATKAVSQAPVRIFVFCEKRDCGSDPNQDSGADEKVAYVQKGEQFLHLGVPASVAVYFIGSAGKNAYFCTFS
jgi:hypothetical protein